jgi:Domain of unknown function (DUF4430)
VRPVSVAVATLVLAGCGTTSTSTHGSARLWVTRDRGAHVLLTTTVPAGLTAMEALRKKAKIELRYGGRYVQAINGIEGSLSSRRDWFYFINGYEGDRSAAEYRLHSGDVEWWDYRSWAKEMRAPIVVGAFPEPFLHGYGGKTRAAVVVTNDPGAKQRLGKLIGARSGEDPNVLEVAPGAPTSLEAEGGDSPGDPIRLRFVGDWRLLLRQPFPFRYRYEVNG